MTITIDNCLSYRSFSNAKLTQILCGQFIRYEIVDNISDEKVYLLCLIGMPILKMFDSWTKSEQPLSCSIVYMDCIVFAWLLKGGFYFFLLHRHRLSIYNLKNQTNKKYQVCHRIILNFSRFLIIIVEAKFIKKKTNEYYQEIPHFKPT